jgi:hypothetical protein
METSQVTPPPHAPVPTPPAHEQCDQCGAAVEHSQRYCVACGAHRRHVRDPASQYLATRTSRARSSAGARPTGTPRKGTSSLLTAVIVAAVPLAIGLGVLVGRSSNNGDAKLLAALRNQKPQVVAGTSTGPAATDTTATGSSNGTVSSTFPLQSGYAVELQTLPGTGTTTAQIASAESAARAKGAPKVGLIVQTQYTVTPKPASGAYVVYSGAYTTKAQASQELAKLKGKFPKATVIQVKSTSTGSANATASGAQVVARTKYGVVHNVVGYHPNAAAEKAGGQIVNKIQHEMGKSYTNAQKGLPDVIPVP